MYIKIFNPAIESLNTRNRFLKGGPKIRFCFDTHTDGGLAQ
jgi:hypothetical protein